MDWLNYHHLLYFWLVVKEGGIQPAAKKLRLAHSTVSGQLKQLEDQLGEQLFDRSGRRLKLTDVGKVAYRYAEEIFPLGQELLDALRGRPVAGRPQPVAVGITDAMPKLVVKHLLAPAFELADPILLRCDEGSHERLLGELAVHNLDVVLTDRPLAPGSSVRAFNHLLGECGVTFFAHKKMARRLAPGFPSSLDGEPMLMPITGSALRTGLERFFSRQQIRPRIVAEIADSALTKVLGQEGLGVFCAPSIIAVDVTRQYEVDPIGDNDEIRERFYAISVERRIKNAAVGAICEGARSEFFCC